jgi:hypothetical protein
METLDRPQSELTERRIARLTLAVGGLAAVGAGWLFSIRVGAGVLLGSLLAWIGFRWLESGLDALVRVSTARAADSAKAGVPLGAVWKLLARYALIVAAVYVTFSLFQIPVLSMLVGLCALGAATILATLYEILHPAG